MIQRDIVYPIFLECCNFTENTFWENIFQNLAYGESPYGTYISKDFICCNYKNKKFSYKIEKKESSIIYKDVYNLLKNKLGIMSKLERNNKIEKMDSNLNTQKNTWNSIKKKNIKSLLIEQYVIRMKKKHKLTIKKSKYLLSLIYICLLFKVLTNKDIIYENNLILDIKGIEISNNCVKITRNIYDSDDIINDDIIINNKINMSDNWEKFLKELKKIK